MVWCVGFRAGNQKFKKTKTESMRAWLKVFPFSARSAPDYSGQSAKAVATVPIFVIAVITQFIRVFENSGKTTYEVWKCERLIDASRSRDILWPSYT